MTVPVFSFGRLTLEERADRSGRISLLATEGFSLLEVVATRGSFVEGDDYLLGGARGERELDCPSGVAGGDAVADQPGEAVLVLRDLRGDFEDLGGSPGRR
jgi:hypothetical protein